MIGPLAPTVRRGWEGVGSTARSVRWSARNRLGEHPRLFLPIARLRHTQSVVGPETGLVIDGFPRCANTFAVIAFAIAQRTPVRLAHHQHAVAQILAATERSIPTLVLTRDPDDAVLSTIIREPFITPRQALVGFARFYERILPRASRFVVARFEEVTDDMGGVTERVNARFGTAFGVFKHTPENVAACFEIIEDRARWPAWADALGRFENGVIGAAEYRSIVAASEGSWARTLPEMRVNRPSPEREAIKEGRRAQLYDASLDGLRTRARQVYEELTAS